MTTGISGFTILRNGIKFDYPFREAIKSLLPIVREMVVAVGKSEDDTLETVKRINSKKVRIIETVWDDSNRADGSEFAKQTNVALAECKHPWAFYLQADEVLHENDLPVITGEVQKYNDDLNIDGFSFKYIHFEATYDYYNPFRYRRAVRLIRNNQNIISIKDAAEFGKRDGKKLSIKKSNAHIYHYGWVKSPKVMLEKSKDFEKYWHDSEYIDDKYSGMEEFDFKMLSACKRFKGSHPEVMKNRISRWNIDLTHKVPKRPLPFRAITWHILLRKWGIIKKEWF